MPVVGLLHPGAMGESIGSALIKAGHTCLWVKGGRSDASRERAERSGLVGVDTVEELVARSPAAIISVCPPEFAVNVAASVRASGFQGLFVDGNAISPQTSVKIERLVTAPPPDGATESADAAVRYVDGSIIGPPAWREGSTRLYLSGEHAREAQALFAGTLVDARIVQGSAGAASALKMAYASWTKGSGALLTATNAFALASGVHEELLAEWALSQPHLLQQSEGVAAGMAPKAWRFAGEMEEISAAYDAAGMPPGFHGAAADVFRRLADYKDCKDSEALHFGKVARTVVDKGPQAKAKQ